MSLRKNAVIELTIDNLSTDGNGVGRHDGMAVFVPLTVPGDRLRVRVVKARPRHCFAIVEELLSPGPDRADPACDAFGRCGGCALRHLDYESECRLKNSWVAENLRRIGGLALELPPLLPSPLVDGYRNKAIYPIRRTERGIQIGFYARRSHRVVESSGCRLHPPFFAELTRAVIRFLEETGCTIYDEETHKGLARALFIRHAEATGEVMLCLIVNGAQLPDETAFVDAMRAACPALTSVVLNENRERDNVLLGTVCRTLWGADVITDELCGLRFSLSPLAFYQINRQGAERLYGVAADFAALTGNELLVDLYCGAGTIGLSMAGRAREVVGVEVVPAAIDDALQNAAQNNITNARFLCADAAEAALQLEREGLRPDVVLLDPPRKGCELSVIDTVCRMAPARVVMVSCDSATAARDVAAFAARGYRPVKAQAVDMFPRTAHVECVVLMMRFDETK